MILHVRYGSIIGFILCGKQNIWSMSRVAPYIVNKILYVVKINYEIQFVWEV